MSHGPNKLDSGITDPGCHAEANAYEQLTYLRAFESRQVMRIRLSRCSQNVLSLLIRTRCSTFLAAKWFQQRSPGGNSEVGGNRRWGGVHVGSKIMPRWSINSSVRYPHYMPPGGGVQTSVTPRSLDAAARSVINGIAIALALSAMCNVRGVADDATGAHPNFPHPHCVSTERVFANQHLQLVWPPGGARYPQAVRPPSDRPTRI
jgi:hypothetical protein